MIRRGTLFEGPRGSEALIIDTWSRGLQTGCKPRGFHKWKRSVASGRGASLSTLIYGRLRTANYRHIQLILASVFPPPVPRSPSLSHLCVASPSPSPITPNPLSHRPPSPLHLPRFVPLHPSPPPLRFLLSLTILPLTVHPSLLPLSPALSSTLCRGLSLFLLPSRASFLRRPPGSSCSRSRCRFNKCPVTLRKYRT